MKIKNTIPLIAILLCNYFLPNASVAQGLRNGPDQIGRNVTSMSFGNDNRWHLRQAEILLSQQNIEEALFELDLAIAQDPYYADAYLLRARLKNQIGMQSEAREDLRTALRLNPYVADLYGYNGPHAQLQILATTPQIELPDEQMNPYYDLLDQWIAKRGADFVFTSASPNLELDYIESAVWHLERGNLESARTEVGKALTENPRSVIAYDLKGLILLKEQRWEEAETALLEATRLEPDFAMAWYNLSQVYQAQGKRDLSLDHLNRSITLLESRESASPEPFLQAYLDRGLARKMLGDFGGALRDINRVIEQQGNRPELLKTRGNIYLIYGLYNKALLDFSTAIQQRPDYAEAWFNRGIAHLLNGDALSACSDFEKSKNLGFEKAEEKARYLCVY